MNLSGVRLMAEVTEIGSWEELQSYRLLWDSLLAKTPQASFFHTYDWFATFWKHFGQQRRMRVLVVRSAGTPIGIVPLCVQTERYQVGNLRVLSYPLSDWGFRYGPIGDNPSATMFMAMRHIRDAVRDWDMLDLRWVPADKSQDNATNRAMCAAGWNPEKSLYQESSAIDLTDADWESYFASRSKKWRAQTRRQFRSLQRDNELSFQRHRPAGAAGGDDDPRWDLFEDCLAVSRNSWQAHSESGNTLCHEHVEPFLRDCHAMAAKLGMLDVALLRINGNPAAFQYNYCYEGQVFGLRMGYDRNIDQQGLGNAVLNLTLEDSFNRGDRLFELGSGEYPFKNRLCTEVFRSYRFTCYPRLALRAQGVRLTRWLKGRRATDKSAPAAPI
jgi:CelD/BcsL family acetyltransferase involved in cellulose biosynthesis